MIGARAKLLFCLTSRLKHGVPLYSLARISRVSDPGSMAYFSSSISNCAALIQRGTLATMQRQPRRYLAAGNKDDYVVHQNALSEAEKEEIESTVKKDFEDWVPYGFCPTDKEEDIFRYKMFMFTSLTVGIVIFIYVYLHLPPRNQRDWVSREAYLELERRQRLGLPLVDKNLIPADHVVLPSMDELGDDYEIII